MPAMQKAIKPALVAVVASALVMGCEKSQITMIGQPGSELPRDCPVAVFPSTTPNYQWKDIATVQTECQQFGRTTCIEQLKKDTCKLGGDTVYAINERKNFAGNISMTATIARGSGGAAAPSGPTPPGSPQLAAQTCSPPCSPGYQCQGTTCVALCNPACTTGMHCANDRTCQPDQPAATK
jgi:hypothetical protein